MTNTLPALGFAKAICEESGWKMSNMRIQKVAYIINGVYLFNKESPMIVEKFQAWRYGPVLPSLYHAFKKFGSSYITEEGTTITFADVKPINKQGEEYEFIEQGVKKLESYTPAELVALTHETDGAWKKTESGGDIPNDLIIEEFSKRLGND